MTGDHVGHQHQVDFAALCRTHGIPCTDQRRVIWNFFAAHAQGHTIPDAVTALAPRGIGRATIYRTVELFERLCLLSCVREAGGKLRYVAVCPGHAHTLICRGCHQVVEFEDCDLALLEKLLSVRTGFIIDGHHLEVYGTCPHCAERA